MVVPTFFQVVEKTNCKEAFVLAGKHFIEVFPCAAHLAEDMSREHLSSFVTFVRAPTTAVYAEADPDDQEQLELSAMTSVSGFTW